MRTGDSVKVKKGIFCPDYENVDISGWQGRIVDTDEEGNLFSVEWDSKTLLAMPEEYIVTSLEDGLDYEILDIEQTDVEPAKERDTKKDVQKVQEKLSLKYEIDEDDFDEEDE